MRWILCAWLLAASPLAHGKNTLAYQHYTKGVELAAKRKWEEALAKFQAAIDLNPNYVASYIEWARGAVMAGRRREGLEKLTVAMNLARTKDERIKIQRERENLSDIFYTNETFQQYQNGLNYLLLEQSGGAVEALEKALRTEPDNLLVLTAYAQALEGEDRQKEALSALERAFSLNDGKRGIRLDLAESSLSQNPERTLQLLKPLMQEAPDERAYWLQAQGLSALKRNREAIDFLKQAADRQPSWLYVHFWLGKLYSLESDGGWNARKSLMTFLKRTQPAVDAMAKDGAPGENRKLQETRAEAELILSRVNKSLE